MSKNQTSPELEAQARRIKQAGLPVWYLFKQLYKYSEGNRKRLVWAWSMLGFAGLIEVLVPPFIVSKMLSIVESQGITSENLGQLLWLLVGMVGAVVLFWALHGPARVMECDNAFQARLNYRERMLSGVLGLSVDWHNEHHSGETIDRVAKGASSIYEFGQNSFETIYAVIKLAGSYFLLAYFFVPSLYIVGGMTVFIAWVIIRFDRVIMPEYRQLNKDENKIAEAIQDFISNILTVIILRVEKLVFDTIMKKARAPHKTDKRNNTLNEIKWFITCFLCSLMVAIVLGAYYITHKGVAVGVVFTGVYLLHQYLQNMSYICQTFSGMFSFFASRQARLLDAEGIIEEFGDGSLTNHVLPKHWRELAIKGLSFTYKGTTSGPQLKNVSLTLERGKRVACIGESGSGKTTFLKVFRELHKPSALELSVDGNIIEDGFAGIARAVALAPQNPEIFAMTIRRNITLGAEYTDDEIRRYTDMAVFTKVALSLPSGLDSAINEKGVNLSGGQQQRLALARALLACIGKDIILLDEPTSSLDSATERRVYANIFAGFPEATIISSIHRLHLLPLFDQIVVFENGQIVDTGTYQELLGRCELFRRMLYQYNAGNGGTESVSDAE